MKQCSLASPPAGEPALPNAWRRRGAALADALRAAPGTRLPLPRTCRGRSVESYGTDPAREKAPGCFWSWWENWELGCGGVGWGGRGCASGRSEFLQLLQMFVFTREMRRSETVSALKYFSLWGRPGWMWIAGGGCTGPGSGTPAQSHPSAPVTCGETRFGARCCHLRVESCRTAKQAGPGGVPSGLGVEIQGQFVYFFFVCVFNSPEPLVKAFLPFPGSEGVGVEIR